LNSFFSSASCSGVKRLRILINRCLFSSHFFYFLLIRLLEEPLLLMLILFII
jgi:hypothetical protein